MRKFAIGTIRLTGRRDIAEATRLAGRDMHRSFKILSSHHDREVNASDSSTVNLAATWWFFLARSSAYHGRWRWPRIARIDSVCLESVLHQRDGAIIR